MKQFEKEKIEQILFDRDKNFLVRSRLIDFLKTVTIDDETIEIVPIVEEEVLRASEGILEGNKLTFTPLSGKQPDYPEYNGEPTI